MSGPPFDPRDPANHAWFVDVNVALDDVEALVSDMLSPPRRRELGPVKHRAMFAETWSKLMGLMGRIPPEDDTGPRGSPAAATCTDSPPTERTSPSTASNPAR